MPDAFIFLLLFFSPSCYINICLPPLKYLIQNYVIWNRFWNHFNSGVKSFHQAIHISAGTRTVFIFAWKSTEFLNTSAFKIIERFHFFERMFCWNDTRNVNIQKIAFKFNWNCNICLHSQCHNWEQKMHSQFIIYLHMFGWIAKLFVTVNFYNSHNFDIKSVHLVRKCLPVWVYIMCFYCAIFFYTTLLKSTISMDEQRNR